MVAKAQLFFFGLSCISELRENAIDQTGVVTDKPI
jgi:hypothetical protein